MSTTQPNSDSSIINKAVAVVTLIATLIAVPYYIFYYIPSDTTIIYGIIKKKKETKYYPIGNAIVKFPNEKLEARTNINGEYSIEISGKGSKEVLILVYDETGKEIHKNLTIDFKKNTEFDTTFFDDLPIANIPKSSPQKGDSVPIIQPKKPEVPNKTTAVPMDIGILAITNNKRDPELAFQFKDWLIQNAKITASNFDINPSIKTNIARKLFGGDNSDVGSDPSLNKIKCLIVVHGTVSFSKSEINESITIATGDYTVLFFEPIKNKINNFFSIKEKGPGISENEAWAAEKDNFFKNLFTHKVSVQ